jgi:hypothetical protein
MDMMATSAEFYSCPRPKACEEKPSASPIITVPLGEGLVTQYWGPTTLVSFFRLLNKAGDVLCQGEGWEYPERAVLSIERDHVFRMPVVDVGKIAYLQILGEKIEDFLRRNS